MTEPELQKLVRAAVLDVLKMRGAPDGGSASIPGSLPCIRVLADRSTEAEAKVTARLRNRYPGGCRLCFSGECLGGAEPELIIVPSLCCASMARLATGSPSGGVLADIMKLLLEGRSVWVLDYCYEDYAQTAPAALYALYADYERKLASYGLRRLPETSPSSIRSQKKLITAKMVEEAAASGVRRLAVSASAIITPLAADAAAGLGVELLKDAGEDR